jgi:uroporphyrinogen decarboxylase
MPDNIMNLIDLLNWFGRRKRLRPGGKLLLSMATKIPFWLLVRIAGRKIITAFAGAPAILLTHSTIQQAVKDPQKLYEATAYTVETMGLDTLCLFADMSLEAEACGCQVSYEDCQVPSVTTHPVRTIDDLNNLPIPDPHRDGRMPIFLETMRLLKKNFTLLKVAEVSGPFTLALSLAGTNIYLDMRRNPQTVRAILEYCERVIVGYARALIESGTDLILIAEPAGSGLSPSDYDNFSLGNTRKIISSLSRPCILHICGKTEHIIEKMCQSGAVALSVDDIDIARAIKAVPRRTVVIRNISPQKLLISSQTEIENETSKLMESVQLVKNFCVAPGCDLSPQTPLENITSFVKTARRLTR